MRRFVFWLLFYPLCFVTVIFRGVGEWLDGRVKAFVEWGLGR